MLQKEFFQVQPFNPNPYWDNTLVNLSGAQKFEEDTVFSPGVYSVIVQAGSARSTLNGGYTDVGYGGKISQNISVLQPFIIRAYCGSKSSGTFNNDGQIGINPYSGIFKVNGVYSNISIQTTNNIFGNAGSSGLYYNQVVGGSSGNCLGNGANDEAAAGSCLHLLPVNGTFGTNYLFAFHTTGGTSGILGAGGSGGAYGGAGSGSVYESSNGKDGGSTPYGTGGTSGGHNGQGIGHGYAYSPGSIAVKGGAAWFNGSSWEQSDLWASNYEDGKIIVKYLGPLY